MRPGRWVPIPATAATRVDGLRRPRANREDDVAAGGPDPPRCGGWIQPRRRPAANPSAAAPKATSRTAVNVEPPTATSAPWKAPTTTSPTAQVQASPAAVKASSSRCGAGVLSSARTAARLVPGRRPLNNPRTRASRVIGGREREQTIGYAGGPCRDAASGPAERTSLRSACREGVDRHGDREDERRVLTRPDVDAVGVTHAEPLLRDRGDGVAVALDLVLVVDD